MRKIEYSHPSRIVDVRWVAECDACGARLEVAHERLARSWEHAHRRFGCGWRLVPDESGRGWRPCPLDRGGRWGRSGASRR